MTGLRLREVTRSVGLPTFGPPCLFVTIFVTTFARPTVSMATVAVTVFATIGAAVAFRGMMTPGPTIRGVMISMTLIAAVRGMVIPGPTMVVAMRRFAMMRAMGRSVFESLSMTFEDAWLASDGRDLGSKRFGAAGGLAPRGDPSRGPIAVEQLVDSMIVDALMAQSDRRAGDCLMCSDVIWDR